MILDDDLINQDALDILCDHELGQGIHRTTFICRLNPDWVVKVEREAFGHANIREWHNWQECMSYKKAADWLAPCKFISPNGRVLIQERTAPLRRSEFPDKLPSFIMDVKAGNIGMLNGRIVIHDYPQMNTKITFNMVDVTYAWSDDE